jgi:hypothetical protein
MYNPSPLYAALIVSYSATQVLSILPSGALQRPPLPSSLHRERSAHGWRKVRKNGEIADAIQEL